MYRKILYVLLIAAFVLGTPALFAAPAAAATALPVKAIGAMQSTSPHLVPPRDDVALRDLQKDGSLPKNATKEQVQAALQQYKAKVTKESRTWVSPQVEEWASKRETQLLSSDAAQAVQPVSVKIFALAVDFQPLVTETINYWNEDCATRSQYTVTVGDPADYPLKGNIAHPDAGDNNTNWYAPEQTANASFYQNMIFGYAGAGRVRMDLIDPRDGQPGINLTGVTVQDYYDKQSGGIGNVTLSGGVFGWVTVDHSEAWYGAPDYCSGTHDGRNRIGAGNYVSVQKLVEDAMVKFTAANPAFPWAEYDANNDGWIDTFWVIHAGMGQESGGGAQGDFSIWSHSWDMRADIVRYPNGYTIPGTTIKVGPYTMQPENAEVGVFSEEFGHNVFGLPDLYTTDAQGSIGFWAIMEGGAWGGYLGGAQPVGMPLWFKMIAVCGEDAGGFIPCNWQDPMLIRNYDDRKATIALGQLEDTPIGVAKGIKINLPPTSETVNNDADPVNNSKGIWSGTGRDDLDITFITTNPITVPAPDVNGGGGIRTLTFTSKWNIETDYDYGYVMASTNGVNWTALQDLGAYFSGGVPALTGNGPADPVTLAFDLTSYAGQQVYIAFRYTTDGGVTFRGWFIDDVYLGDTKIDDFELADAATDTVPGWTNNGWFIVPRTTVHPRYYLVEWRNDTKYDGMVKTSYLTQASGENLWTVQRVPYNIPGALVYLRDTNYTNTYALNPNLPNPPSFGPKYQLLLVDMNPMPIAYKSPTYYSYTSSRTSSYDAALTTQPSKGFVVNLPAWPRAVRIPAKPPVKNFYDGNGYYAGVFNGGPCAKGYLCYWNKTGSAVLTSTNNYDLYSVRTTNYNNKVIVGLEGLPFPVAPFWYGDGNPRSDGVNFGVRVELLSRTRDGRVGVVRVYNRK